MLGDVHKIKTWTIDGNMLLNECDTHTGCIGNKECSDGRFTATSQHLSSLSDSSTSQEFYCLCL